MFVDMPLQELQSYRPDIDEPDDFDEFWSDRLADARGPVAAPVLTPADTPLIHQDVFDVTFAGAGGDPIKGWLSIPRNMTDNRPVIIEFVGYNGGRGDPLDWLGWPATGFPHFIMDNRGQGGGWRHSDTPDPSDSGAPSSNGFLTKGITDPKSHFYARMFVDAVRAVDAVTSLPIMAGRQVMVTGASQGGALALVAAHLHPAVVAALPDVPFLCHIQRASAVTPARPYAEIAEYCSVNHATSRTSFAPFPTSTSSIIPVERRCRRCFPWACSTRSPLPPRFLRRTTIMPVPRKSRSTRTTATKAVAPHSSTRNCSTSAGPSRKRRTKRGSASDRPGRRSWHHHRDFRGVVGQAGS